MTRPPGAQETKLVIDSGKEIPVTNVEYTAEPVHVPFKDTRLYDITGSFEIEAGKMTDYPVRLVMEKQGVKYSIENFQGWESRPQPYRSLSTVEFRASEIIQNPDSPSALSYCEDHGIKHAEPIGCPICERGGHP